MEFARQQHNQQSPGRKDSGPSEVASKDSPASKTSSPVSKKASKDVDPVKKPQHVPREPQEGQLVNYEHDAMPNFPEASKGIIQEDLMKAPKVIDAPVNIEDVKVLKKPKLKK